MRDWRTTLIASIAIPASIVATFTVMRVFGFTLNNITLLALTLSVGIVIDDAIVVLENIFRHVEEKGSPPRVAAVEATAEIGLAVSATTLSLVVIFLPVAFMSGTVGRFFNSYGITVAFAILFSWFISFTLTPMLASRFLKVKHAGTGRARPHRRRPGSRGGRRTDTSRPSAGPSVTGGWWLSSPPECSSPWSPLPEWWGRTSSVRRPERVRDLHTDAGRVFAGDRRRRLPGGGGGRAKSARREASPRPDRRRGRRGRDAGDDLRAHGRPRRAEIFPVRHHEGRPAGDGEVPLPAPFRPEHLGPRARGGIRSTPVEPSSSPGRTS